MTIFVLLTLFYGCSNENLHIEGKMVQGKFSDYSEIVTHWEVDEEISRVYGCSYVHYETSYEVSTVKDL